MEKIIFSSCLQPPSQSVLGYELRKEGAPHNCLDDACAAMKLILARIVHGVDNISFAHEDVSETEMVSGDFHGLAPMGKRAFQGDDFDEFKRLKIDQKSKEEI